MERSCRSKFLQYAAARSRQVSRHDPSGPRAEPQPRLVIDRVDDAIAVYKAVFGAELVERFAAPNGVVVHAAIQIGASVFSIAEEVPDWKLLAPPTVGGSPVLLHLTLPDPDEACARMVERGGTVAVPIADRFWGRREGRIRDPLGHLWILSCPIAKPGDDEIQRRLTETS